MVSHTLRNCWMIVTQLSIHMIFTKGFCPRHLCHLPPLGEMITHLAPIALPPVPSALPSKDWVGDEGCAGYPGTQVRCWQISSISWNTDTEFGRIHNISMEHMSGHPHQQDPCVNTYRYFDTLYLKCLTFIFPEPGYWKPW